MARTQAEKLDPPRERISARTWRAIFSGCDQSSASCTVTRPRSPRRAPGCARRSRRGSPPGGSAGSAGRRAAKSAATAAVPSLLRVVDHEDLESPWVCPARPPSAVASVASAFQAGTITADPLAGARPLGPGSQPARLSRPSGRARVALAHLLQPEAAEDGVERGERRRLGLGAGSPAAGAPAAGGDQRQRGVEAAGRAAPPRARRASAPRPSRARNSASSSALPPVAGGRRMQARACATAAEAAAKSPWAADQRARDPAASAASAGGPRRGQRREVAQRGARVAAPEPVLEPRALSGPGGRSRARAQASSPGGMAARKRPGRAA